uniref:Uncharacterized protein n=1 Tax=Scophthalmus maximus TaxID=52904 RepID=A0A8D3DE70_SCOMX
IETSPFLIYCCGTLVLLLLIPRVCQAGNILVVPVEGSHWLNMDILLKALHSRGHNITILRTSRSWYIPYNSSDYTLSQSKRRRAWIRNSSQMLFRSSCCIAPSPISYVPMTGSGNTDKMNILQRVKNMGIYLLTQTQYHLVVKQTYQRICDKYLGPDIEYHQLVLNADIWLMRTDFVFEYPRPTMPNVVYMGGFHCTKVQLI